MTINKSSWIGMFLISGVVLSVTAGSAFSATGDVPFQIGADMTSGTIEFAVSEFQSLSSSISGRQSTVLQDPFLNKFVADDIVLISGEKRLKLVQALSDSGVVHLDKLPVSPDGFLIESVSYKNRNILIIASRSDVGALYGVYDYFEQYCGAGYFYDGDYLPRKQMVFNGILRTYDPILVYRGTSCWTAHRGLSRNFPPSWDMPHWERFLKWMAKSKLNFLAGYELGQENAGGDISVLAFPDIYRLPPPGPPEGAEVYNQDMPWINSWTKDLIAQRKLTQEVFNYGRILGIKFVNTYEYGKVFIDYVKKYPQYKYMSSLLAPGEDYYHMGKTWDSLLPGTPECREYTFQIWKTIRDTYGTDSMWRIGWFTEIFSLPGKSIVDMKIQAAQEQADIIKRLDNEGNILIDMWGMGKWSKEDLDKLWDGLPKNVGVIIFNNGPLNEKLGYLGGHKWIMNYLVSYAGDLQIHGDPDVPVKHLKQYLKDPKAMRGLLGYTHGSETLENPFYTQLAASLAWDPEGFDKEEFIRRYVRSRFGDVSFPNMYESVRALSEAMPLYGWHDGSDGRLIVQRFTHYLKENIDLEKARKADELWEKALGYALKEAGNQSNDRLYHNYLVELTLQFMESKLTMELTALADLCKSASSAESPGRRELARNTIQQRQKTIGGIYEDIIALLSTDPDYVLKNDIDRLMVQEGANPYTPIQYQRWGLVDYCSFQAVEYYRDYYYPLFRLCMSEVEDAIITGKKPEELFASKEFNDRKYKLWKQFFDKPLSPVPDDAKKASSAEIAKEIYGKYAAVDAERAQ
jgi:hypothetical protein